MQKRITKVAAVALAATTLLTGCNNKAQKEFPYTVQDGNKVVVDKLPSIPMTDAEKGDLNIVSKEAGAYIDLSAEEIQMLNIISSQALLENEAVQQASINGSTTNELLGAVYDYVANNIQVDTTQLIPLTETEEKQIRQNLSRVISCLKGADNKAMPDEFANYMLWEFSRTQNTWDVAIDENGIPLDYQILGIDPATRKVFVDLVFETTDTLKIPIPESKIVKGSYTEANSKELRQKEYLRYLDAKIAYDALVNGKISSSGNIWDMTDSNSAQNTLEKKGEAVEEMLEEFTRKWGPGSGDLDSDLASILLEQQELSLIERTRHYITDPNTGKMNLEYTQAFKDYLKSNREFNFTDEQLAALDLSSTFTKWTDFEAVLKDKYKYSATQLKEVALGGASAISTKFLQTQDIGMYTYPGIAAQTTFPISADTPARMTFRFIFDFDYDLTTEASIKTSSVYLKNYALPGEGYDAESLREKFGIDESKIASISVVKPYLDRKIYSYQRCIEQDNLIGLYKLFGSINYRDDFTNDLVASDSRFQDWDKYYSEWIDTCYTKFDAYDYDIVGWTNNTIQVLVNRSKKIRGVGTQMTFPNYSETVLIEFAVEQDDVFVKGETVISTQLTGEPLSMIRDVTGVADQIAFDTTSFSSASEAGVVQAIQNFSDYQLTYLNTYIQTGSAPTLEYSYTKPGAISFGVTPEVLSTIKDNMTSAIVQAADLKVAPSEKISYLGTWTTKSNVFCRVRLRETYMFKGNANALNTESYISLVNRDGVWVVVDYTRISTTMGATPTSDKGCLSHDYIEDGKASTTRYKETKEESERPMGAGTEIDHANVDNSQGDTGIGTKPEVEEKPAQTTITQTTTTQPPVEDDTPVEDEGGISLPGSDDNPDEETEETPATTTTGTTYNDDTPEEEEDPVEVTTTTEAEDEGGIPTLDTQFETPF